MKNNICPQCGLENGTLSWWETETGWVCYGCGMDRREEQLRIDMKTEKKQKGTAHADKKTE